MLSNASATPAIPVVDPDRARRLDLLAVSQWL